MADLQQCVYDILSDWKGLESLKTLFWQELNYERENTPFPKSNWTEKIQSLVADDPLVFAKTGADGNFRIFYFRLRNQLQLTAERQLVEPLINQGYPGLFVFSDREQVHWHLVNVREGAKKDDSRVTRRIFRRITLGPNEKVRTASERLSMLDVDAAKLSSAPMLVIQSKHDEAFDVEKLNKEFYSKIALSFTRLVGGKRAIGSRIQEFDALIKLPSTADHQKLQEFAVRLIGRLVFCWFLKKKESGNKNPLIPENILSKKSVGPNYYHGVLEPLFFEVLNTPVENRLDEYKSGVWQNIPFLNGGLFEPNQDDYYELDNVIHKSKCLNNLVIPDSWFRELFEIFESYNFTIEENTTIDISLSIDPEILGRIFENLLAEINPETGETARKNTGSYYTPRPIVEYMVDESLKQYLLTNTGVNEEKITDLLDYTIDTHSLTEAERKSVIDALDDIKIIDPACGSGAFPMGILQKMVLILQKVDPESIEWLIKQLDRIPDRNVREKVEEKLMGENWNYIHKLGIIQNSIYGVDIQPIALEISKLRFFLSLIVDGNIDDNKPNRGLSPLPNLEFKFVCANSLIGLPETEKKDLFADSFFEDFNREVHNYFNAHEPDEKHRVREKIEALINQKTQEKFDTTQSLNRQITSDPRKIKERAAETERLTKLMTLWESYKNLFKNEPVGFFDIQYFFPECKDGFDIVIANPPYVRADDPIISEQRDAIMTSKNYQTLWEKWDLYVAFIEKGYGLLTNKGVLEFIISDAYMSSKYAEKSHEYFLRKATISRIDFCSDLKIFEAAVRNIIIEFTKHANPDHIPLRIKHKDNWDNFIVLPSKKQSEMGKNTFKIDSENRIIGDLSNTLTWGEICYVSYGLRPSSDERYWKGEFVKNDLISDTKDKIHSKRYVEGKWINKYFVEKIKYLEWNTDRSPKKLVRPTFPELYVPEKIMLGGMTGAIFDESGLLCNHSITISVLWKDLANVNNRSIEGSIKKDFHIKEISLFRKQLQENSELFSLKYLLAILNSKFAYKFLDSVRRSQIGFYPDDLKKLPIKKNSEPNQKPFIEIVDKILAITGTDDYLRNPDADTSELEAEIDQLVYELYGLSQEEIEIVESSIGNYANQGDKR